MLNWAGLKGHLLVLLQLHFSSCWCIAQCSSPVAAQGSGHAVHCCRCKLPDGDLVKPEGEPTHLVATNFVNLRGRHSALQLNGTMAALESGHLPYK